MRKTGLLIFPLLLLLSGCAKQSYSVSESDFISATEAPGALRPAYHLLSDRFQELSQNLQFDIAIPAEMLLYDSGASDNVVRLCDPSGKNSIVLESRNKEDYEKLYAEYLHSVSASMTDYHNIHIYDKEILSTGNPARHFDIKLTVSTGETDENQRDITEQKYIRYWFLDKQNRKSEQERTAYLIIIESDQTNVQTMMNIISQFQEF